MFLVFYSIFINNLLAINNKNNKRASKKEHTEKEDKNHNDISSSSPPSSSIFAWDTSLADNGNDKGGWALEEDDLLLDIPWCYSHLNGEEEEEEEEEENIDCYFDPLSLITNHHHKGSSDNKGFTWGGALDDISTPLSPFSFYSPSAKSRFHFAASQQLSGEDEPNNEIQNENEQNILRNLLPNVNIHFQREGMMERKIQGEGKKGKESNLQLDLRPPLWSITSPYQFPPLPSPSTYPSSSFLLYPPPLPLSPSLLPSSSYPNQSLFLPCENVNYPLTTFVNNTNNNYDIDNINNTMINTNHNMDNTMNNNINNGNNLSFMANEEIRREEGEQQRPYQPPNQFSSQSSYQHGDQGNNNNINFNVINNRIESNKKSSKEDFTKHPPGLSNHLYVISSLNLILKTLTLNQQPIPTLWK